MAGRSSWFTAGLVGGILSGIIAWSGAQTAYRRELFSRHPMRRFAALGDLAGRPSFATAQLLREYIAWESRPLLRGRAVRMLRAIEQTLT